MTIDSHEGLIDLQDYHLAHCSSFGRGYPKSQAKEEACPPDSEVDRGIAGKFCKPGLQLGIGFRSYLRGRIDRLRVSAGAIQAGIRPRRIC